MAGVSDPAFGVPSLLHVLDKWHRPPNLLQKYEQPFSKENPTNKPCYVRNQKGFEVVKGGDICILFNPYDPYGAESLGLSSATWAPETRVT